MNSEVDVHANVKDLRKHWQLPLFGGRVADPEGAVLLVRGALAEGDSERAENLADATRRLAATTPHHPDLAGAAAHARGLVDQDAALLERVAVRYSATGARATALEDAGRSWVGQGDQRSAEAVLRQADKLLGGLGS